MPASTRSPRPSSRLPEDPRSLASATRRRLDYGSRAAQRRDWAMADQESASEASAKVQEVAANMQEIASTRKRISGSKAEGVARRYFAAIDARDLETAVSLWAPGGRENVRGRV